MTTAKSSDLGARLFSYAVITDTHLNQGEDECNSPFAVNKLANGRMRFVVRDLNQRELAFVIHLGDLLHPVPAIPHLYARAAALFNQQISELRHPIYLLPGNHDVGDKPIDWGPAGVVRDAFLALWKEHFGANYQAFTHQGCRFVLLDAQIINSGLEAEAQQRRWLEDELTNNADTRTFINLHYPPYLTYPDEDEHYDNLGEPGRSWLLALLERHDVEALFAGHVHNFWYHRHADTDCYLLPSTAFVRQDYAEMYRCAPPPGTEAGRNDTSKLGYFIVHMHERGHLCEIVRTYGTTAEPDSPISPALKRVPAVHPRHNALTRFGFDMRQNWLEVIEIPPSGGLDEFDRKRTRNDYALMALLEMGVRRLRLPARDLLDPAHRARLDDLHRLGFLFTLFSFGEPDQALRSAITGAGHLLDAWEVAHTWEQLPALASAVSDTARTAGVSLFLSKLRSKDEMERGGEKYYHMINHGFTVDDSEQIAVLGAIAGVDGVVFRVAGEMSPWASAREIGRLVEAHGLQASLHVRMSIGSPGSHQEDEAWVAARALEALAAAAGNRSVYAYLDAFSDIDRGYFVRQGVVDRLYNPRPAFHALKHLTAGLLDSAANGEFLPGDDGVTLLDNAGRRHVLVLDDDANQALSLTGAGRLINLGSGELGSARRSTDTLTPRTPYLWIAD